MRIKTLAIAHHRNGVAGQPFDVILFKERGPGGSRMVGIVFDEPRYCAVLDIGLLAAGDIALGSNSWRADVYEPHLRAAIAQRDAADQLGSDVPSRQPLAVVTLRRGLIEQVQVNIPLAVIIEDWDCLDQVAPATYDLGAAPLAEADEQRLLRKFNFNLNLNNSQGA